MNDANILKTLVVIIFGTLLCVFVVFSESFQVASVPVVLKLIRPQTMSVALS